MIKYCMASPVVIARNRSFTHYQHFTNICYYAHKIFNLQHLIQNFKQSVLKDFLTILKRSAS